MNAIAKQQEVLSRLWKMRKFGKTPGSKWSKRERREVAVYNALMSQYRRSWEV